MKKELWEDEIFNGLHGFQRANPDPKLYDQIRTRILEARRVVSGTYVLMAAASLTLLIMANLHVLQQQSMLQTKQVSTYTLDNANFIIYP